MRETGRKLQPSDSATLFTPAPRYLTGTQDISFVLGVNERTDSYLSPLRYSGLSYGVQAAGYTPVSSGKYPWILTQKGLALGSFPISEAYSAGMLIHSFGYNIGAECIFPLPYGIKLSVGPELAALYERTTHTRNQNNSENTAADLDLLLSVRGGYQLPWHKFPMRILIDARLGVVGLGVTPNFKESWWQVSDLSGIARHLTLHGWGARRIARAGVQLYLPVARVCSFQLGYEYAYSDKIMRGLDRIHSAHLFTAGVSLDLFSLGGYAAAHTPHFSNPMFTNE